MACWSPETKKTRPKRPRITHRTLLDSCRESARSRSVIAVILVIVDQLPADREH